MDVMHCVQCDSAIFIKLDNSIIFTEIKNYIQTFDFLHENDFRWEIVAEKTIRLTMEEQWLSILFLEE